jgi:hypothetical protein
MTSMRTFKTRWWVGVVALAALVVATPAVAKGPDALLYEVTENVRMVNGVRVSTSQLSGAVKHHALLCPKEFATRTRRAETCTITVVGTSEVDINTGVGPVEGSFSVVVQDPNATDAPELVVMAGRFVGTMDMRPALTGTAPLAYVTNASFTVDTSDAGKTGTQAFAATFRLPFSPTVDGGVERARPGRDAYYLLDNGKIDKVNGKERSLGAPTVRVELDFENAVVWNTGASDGE